jgi:hypothetical protein
MADVDNQEVYKSQVPQGHGIELEIPVLKTCSSLDGSAAGWGDEAPMDS